jgi:predicted metal-dependent hydrolase
MAEVVPEPRLTPEEREQFERGVAQFNAGYYFECHDTLEELWTGLRGPARDFFQGLIQVAVAFYHLGNDNPAGAQSLLQRALKRFERYPERYAGFDLGGYRERIAAWLEALRDAAPQPMGAEPPRWSFGED